MRCNNNNTHKQLFYGSVDFVQHNPREPVPSNTLMYTVSQKNVLTLKRYISKLQGAILMKFGRNIQNTLE